MQEFDPAPEPERPAPSEVIRFLMPSPIGGIGMELHDQVVTRVLVAPKARERRGFVPFQELEDSEFLEELFGRVSEYFAGARRQLGVEWDLAPSGVSVFARRVLKETAKIPYGRTRTYRQIAAAAGRPEAYRLVLAALVENPVPIAIPCHRVVTNKSGIGSYIGGAQRKRWLIEMEREALRRGEE
jgi:methylated-DNA-[protein]-cysteine S-methyltransferase